MGRVMESHVDMTRLNKTATEIDTRPQHRFFAQGLGDHRFRVDAVLPAYHVHPLPVKTLYGRGDQRQCIGLDGKKDDIGSIFGKVVDAGASPCYGLLEVFRPFDDYSGVYC